MLWEAVIHGPVEPLPKGRSFIGGGGLLPQRGFVSWGTNHNSLGAAFSAAMPPLNFWRAA